MKLKALTTALLLGAGIMQANAQSGPHIGLITGYHTSWVLDQKLFDDPNYEGRTTWNSAPFGVVLGYKMNPSSTIQVEVFGNNMGAEYDIVGSDVFGQETKVVGEKRIEMKYTSVPILYKFTAGEKVRFNFHFGPQFNFLSEGSEINQIDQTTVLRANLSSTDLTAADVALYPNPHPTATDPEIPTKSVLLTAGTYDRTPNGKEDFNKTDIGAAIGLGMEADLFGNLYLSANLRACYGFKDIRSDARKAEFEARNNYDSRTNATAGFQIGLHYRFDM